MLKVIAIYDQIQSGMGTKDDKMLPLGGKNTSIGPSVMMEKFLKANDLKVVACLYCGTGTYLENKTKVSQKICEKLEQLKPDIVICGPAFDYSDYAMMCAELAVAINQTTSVPAIASMAKENEAIIRAHKAEIHIVKCPRKGEAELNKALENLCTVAGQMARKEVNPDEIKTYCF
ncbi:GrdB-related putative oxidoreductase [Fusibacter sp. 3D3]|uniref:GrdB-related putative oxidoreductase n=1 Tax=Fusibacter sp. 3D3 TaxID=1048380 RepID=UPI0008529CBC|nr:GrdB-related putative oxidoreductase [Fusibacter sp. 3D3]GAU76307.1 conserved domain protein [Fusibacter sp. 3D3]